MSREIKFRARRVDNGEWVYGQLVYMEEHIIKKWKKDKTGIPDKKITESICKIYAPTGSIKTGGLQQGQNGEPHKWKQDFIIYNVIPETIGQFTGLKDKNGKEIYEGDAVRHCRVIIAPCDYHSGEPAFDDCEYVREGHISITASKGVALNGKQETRDYNEDKRIGSRKYNENPGCWNEYAEIIGNIHENPELVK